MREDTGRQIEELLRHLLAIELWRAGLTQKQIAKRLKMSGTTVSEMLKGVSRQLSSGAIPND